MKSNKNGARRAPSRETVVTLINLAIIDQKCAMEMICNFVISQRNHDYNFVMKLFFKLLSSVWSSFSSVHILLILNAWPYGILFFRFSGCADVRCRYD